MNLSYFAQLFCGTALGVFCLGNLIIVSGILILRITYDWLRGQDAKI